MSIPPNQIEWRLTSLERRVEKLWDLKPEVVAREVEELNTDIKELRDELRGVRRALWGFGLSIASAAIIFAFSAFQVWGA